LGILFLGEHPKGFRLHLCDWIRTLTTTRRSAHHTIHGISHLNFDGFAPASQWEELSFASSPKKGKNQPNFQRALAVQ